MIHRLFSAGVWIALASCSPAMMNERIALTDAAFVGYDLEAAVDKLHSLGFPSMAIHHGGPTREDFPTLALDKSTDEQKARTKRIMSRVKQVSIHQNGQTDWKPWIDGAAFAGARIVTFHFRPRESVEAQVKFFMEAGDYAREKGVRIGIENVRGSYEKYQEVIRRVRHPNVGVIIDLGHVPMFDDLRSIQDDAEKTRRSNDRLEEMIRRYKGRLWHMHIHNSRPSEKWKDHYGDLDGPIDIARVIRTLNEVGYDGMMVLELHRQNETMEQKARFGWYVSELLEK